MSLTIPIIDPHEPPRARAQRKLASLAHRALAELLADSVPVDAKPVSASAVCRESGMRIVVRLLRFAGRAWEPAADAPPAPALPQRAVEAKALKAAPGPAELPITLKQLAKKAGYGNNGHFQEAVRGLIDRGLLLRVRGGIRRARET